MKSKSVSNSIKAISIAALWSGSNVVGSVTYLSTAILAAWVILLYIEYDKLKYKIPGEKKELGIIIGYIIIIASLFISEIYSTTITIWPVTKITLLFGIFTHLIYSVENKFLQYFPKFYSNTFYWLTLINIVGALIVSIFNNLPTLNFSGASNREYSFIGVLMTSKIDGFSDYLIGENFYRFQSIFDEPGTFAFFLIPVILYYHSTKNYKRLMIISAGFLATLSAGGWILLLLLLFVFTQNNKLRIASIIATVGIILLLWITYDNWIISRIIIEKFFIPEQSSSLTSLGQRTNELEYLYAIINSYRPIGYGMTLNELSEVNISVRYIHLIYSGGWLSILGLSIFLLMGSLICRQIIVNRQPNSYFYSYLGGMILLSGFQRMMIFDLLQFIILFSFVIGYYINLKSATQ